MNKDKQLKLPENRTIVTKWTICPAPDDAPDLRKYGFAPGDYFFWCGTCKQQEIAAKRSSTCYKCAIEQYNKDKIRTEFEETWKHKLPVSNDEYFICLKTIIDKLNNQISALIDEQETTNAILKLMELKTLQALYAQSQNFLSIK